MFKSQVSKKVEWAPAQSEIVALEDVFAYMRYVRIEASSGRR